MSMRAMFIAAAPVSLANAMAARTYPDPLLAAVASKENVAKAQEIDADNLCVMACLWGYPLPKLVEVQP